MADDLGIFGRPYVKREYYQVYAENQKGDRLLLSKDFYNLDEAHAFARQFHIITENKCMILIYIR